jgi:hypothetical protein
LVAADARSLRIAEWLDEAAPKGASPRERLRPTRRRSHGC